MATSSSDLPRLAFLPPAVCCSLFLLCPLASQLIIPRGLFWCVVSFSQADEMNTMGLYRVLGNYASKFTQVNRFGISRGRIFFFDLLHQEVASYLRDWLQTSLMTTTLVLASRLLLWRRSGSFQCTSRPRFLNSHSSLRIGCGLVLPLANCRGDDIA